jgi:hypothetical protein
LDGRNCLSEVRKQANGKHQRRSNGELHGAILMLIINGDRVIDA